MAISTLYSHVSRAIDFFNKNSIYFAIAKTSPWSNDSNGKTEMDPQFSPPEENATVTALSELIGFKKAEVVRLVVPDVDGEISYDNGRWRAVSASSAYAEGAKYVYLETNIRSDELPIGFYRQIGVYTGLVLANGVPTSKYNLLPSEVSNTGVLEVYDNRQPSNRQADQREILSIIIEF